MIHVTVGGERREMEEGITVDRLLTIENVEMPVCYAGICREGLL